MAKVGLSLLAVVAIAIGGFLYYLDAVARGAIETGGEAALGVETRLESASIGLLSGKLGLSGLTIANPEGFQAEHFLVLRQGQATIDLSQITADRVGISDFVLEGVELDLAYVGGKSNFGAVLRNLEGEGGQSAEPAAQEAGSSGPRIELDRVQIRDLTARVRIGALGQERSEDLHLPELSIPIPRSGGDATVTIAEIAGHVVRGVLLAVSKKGSGLPAEARAQLAATVGSVRTMGESELGNAVQKLGEAGRRGVDGLGRLFKRPDDD